MTNPTTTLAKNIAAAETKLAKLEELASWNWQQVTEASLHPLDPGSEELMEERRVAAIRLEAKVERLDEALYDAKQAIAASVGDITAAMS
tara:strand:- start:6356 stop:6625 length:270 start_codon:yes stop_codon:yes gene_type:complete